MICSNIVAAFREATDKMHVTWGKDHPGNRSNLDEKKKGKRTIFRRKKKT